MPGFPGFDASEFPETAEMAWLKSHTNLVWCGYYLPAPSRQSRSWMGQRPALHGAGWGLAPLYVGQQIAGPGRHNVNGPQGAIDGRDAASLLSQDGFALGTFIYLDLEDGPPLKSPRTDYVSGWASAVNAGGFKAGVYCSHLFAADVHELLPDARVWAYKVDTNARHPFPGTNFPDLHPAGSGYPGAFIWQLGQNCQLSLPSAPSSSILVDLSSAITIDPGAP